MLPKHRNRQETLSHMLGIPLLPMRTGLRFADESPVSSLHYFLFDSGFGLGFGATRSLTPRQGNGSIGRKDRAPEVTD